MRRYRSDLWFRALLRCQTKVAASNPNPKYVEAYIRDEIHYWLHIPKWLYESKFEPGVTRCLDIGCAYGTLGLYSKMILGANVWCTDIRTDYLSRVLLDQHGFEFALSNVELEPLPWDTHFEIIILTEVLEHFNFHPVATLRKIRDSLGINGRLYLSTPDAAEWGREDNRFESYEDMPSADETIPLHDGHIYIYDEEELLEIAERSGLVVDKLDYSPGIAARHINMVLSAEQA